MKRMKKFLSLILVFAMLITAMAGCGKDEKETAERPANAKELIKAAKIGHIQLPIPKTML